MLNKKVNDDEIWDLREIRIRKIISNILKDIASALVKPHDGDDEPTGEVAPISENAKGTETKADKEYESYESLWKKYKEASKRFIGLKDLIKEDTLFSFIVTASQFENVLALYRVVTAELLKDPAYETSDEFSDVLVVLTRLFDINAETRKGFVYARYECDVQKRYDLDRATKMPNDPEAGKVIRNVLWGIRNKNTEKIESKCIVRVG
ncbi:hypothetical protein [Fibrobacter sp. HC4]|uniref:hypothetical protein n=1 Tax=Fibrobacter sp. HC4 TaxID=3239812 RepID=UPI002019089C|nr:hypothetical protein [Fibrobacter succinogenes]MCL4102002.1 hypothetical protein [Fibrobacter succinogenes]